MGCIMSGKRGVVGSVAVIGAAVLALAGCGGSSSADKSPSPSSSPPSPTASKSVSPSPTTPTPKPTPTVPAPQLQTLSVEHDIHCSGETVPATVIWTSTGAQNAEVTVNDAVIDKGLPASGTDDISLTCADTTYTVGVAVFNSAGAQASAVQKVRTIKDPTPTPMPDIIAFDVQLGECLNGPQIVTATYQTVGTTKISFEVDGTDVGAPSDAPVSGSSTVPKVPCDNTPHQITLVASNDQGNSAQKSQTVGLYQGDVTNGSTEPLTTGEPLTGESQ